MKNKEKETVENKNFSKSTLWILGITFFVILVFAFILYIKFRNELKSGAQQNLSDIANQKSEQITQWIQMQYNIGDFFFDNNMFQQRLIDFINNRDNKISEKELRTQFQEICKEFHYYSLRFIDTNALIIASDRPNVRQPGEYMKKTIKELNNSKKIFLTDFHFYANTDTIHFDLIIPVLNKSTNRLYGYITCEIDPDDYLFPIVQQYNRQATSFECFIIKNENGNARILSNLKFREKSALNIVIDKSLTDNIPVIAVNGNRGIVEGYDYRNEKVISYIQNIPGTNWIMITKIDESEIYKQVNKAAVLFGFMLLLSLVLVSWIIVSGYRRIEQSNINARLKLEEEKRYLNEHYNFFIENTNSIIILTDTDGNIKEFNQNAIIAYGYTPEEMLKMNIKEIMTEDIKSTGQLRETIHRKKDGSKFPVEMSSKLITLNDKIFRQNFIRDITERKSAQKRIYHLNIIYSVLSQINQCIVRVKDRNELLRRCVDIVIEYGKFRVAWVGIIEKDTGNIRPLYIRSSGKDNINDLMKNLINKYAHLENPTKKSIETKLTWICNDLTKEVRDDLIRFYAEENNFLSEVSIPLIYRDEVIGVFNILHTEANYFLEEEKLLMEEIKGDISYALDMIQKEKESREAKENLERSENKFKTIFENASDSILLVNGEKIIDSNIQTEYLFGYNKEELIGKSIFSLSPGINDNTFFVKRILNQAKKGIPKRFLLNLRKKNGSLFKAEISVNTAVVNGELFAILMLRDYTERFKIEEELLKAKNHAEEMSKLKTNFLSNMSHEIRTPLNGIMGFSEILMELASNEKQKSISSKILISGKRLLNTLNNIIELAKIESGDVHPKKESVKISDILEEITDIYKHDAEVKNLNLKCEIVKDSRSYLDADLLRQIVSNLISNAVTFTDFGNVSVRLNEKIEKGKKYSVIEIADTGIGIKKEFLDKIFEPFRQVSEGYGRHYEGAGIGLTISRNYTELMGGKIEVLSEEGKGSVFSVIFPAITENEKVIKGKNFQDEIPKKKINVLLVEDDINSLNYAKIILERFCNVDIALTGTESIRKAKENLYDIILMDIRLNDMDGLQAVKEIRKSGRQPDIPIAAVTAYAYKNDKDYILKNGCDYYLSKPYKIEELQNLVIKAISNSKT